MLCTRSPSGELSVSPLFTVSVPHTCCHRRISSRNTSTTHFHSLPLLSDSILIYFIFFFSPFLRQSELENHHFFYSWIRISVDGALNGGWSLWPSDSNQFQTLFASYTISSNFIAPIRRYYMFFFTLLSYLLSLCCVKARLLIWCQEDLRNFHTLCIFWSISIRHHRIEYSKTLCLHDLPDFFFFFFLTIFQYVCLYK